jgi:hypothetical protein
VKLFVLTLVLVVASSLATANNRRRASKLELRYKYYQNDTRFRGPEEAEVWVRRHGADLALYATINRSAPQQVHIRSPRLRLSFNKHTFDVLTDGEATDGLVVEANFQDNGVAQLGLPDFGVSAVADATGENGFAFVPIRGPRDALKILALQHRWVPIVPEHTGGILILRSFGKPKRSAFARFPLIEHHFDHDELGRVWLAFDPEIEEPVAD